MSNAEASEIADTSLAAAMNAATISGSSSSSSAALASSSTPMVVNAAVSPVTIDLVHSGTYKAFNKLSNQLKLANLNNVACKRNAHIQEDVLDNVEMTLISHGHVARGDKSWKELPDEQFFELVFKVFPRDDIIATEPFEYLSKALPKIEFKSIEVLSETDKLSYWSSIKECLKTVGKEAVARMSQEQIKFLISKKLIDQLTKNRTSESGRQTASLFREKLLTHGDFVDFNEYMLQVGIILVELKR